LVISTSRKRFKDNWFERSFMNLTVEQAAQTIVDPNASNRIARAGAAAVLRAQSAAHWVERRPASNPFGGVTHRADILEVEKNSDTVRHYPRTLLGPAETAESGPPVDEAGPSGWLRTTRSDKLPMGCGTRRCVSTLPPAARRLPQYSCSIN
jgi:hypothetical protein